MPSKERLQALVDGIFSVAMTLLVLDIKLPAGLGFDSNAGLLDHFGEVASAFRTYALSFVVLAMFWIAHDYQFRYVKRLDRGLVWINMAFLLLTTTVPFTTNLVTSHGNLSLAVAAYAGNLLLLGFALLLHIRYLAGHPSLAAAEFHPATVARVTRRLATVCAIPGVSMAVAVLSPYWAMHTLLAMVLLHFLPHASQGEADEDAV
jgi:uncharacterized membrane protein